MRRVLFVDDDVAVCDLVRGYLATDEVTTATNSQDALAIATSTSFDLILIDLAMPGLDGFTLISRVRGMDRHAATPVVAVSGVYDEAEEAVDEVMASGAAGFLPKPFGREQLAKVLEHAAPKAKK